MEAVLALYHRPYDARFPLICLDEKSKELHGRLREPEPVSSGRVAREDSEYARHGTANLFLTFEPLTGQRQVKVTERRTRQDWAEVIRELVDERYPEAERLILVMDNLNTHTLGSLYETFPATEARWLAEKIELHYTPKHGSWSGTLWVMAAIELSVLGRQCLARRIPDLATLTIEVAAWEDTRNAANTRMEWRFTTADARIKVKRLYPTLLT